MSLFDFFRHSAFRQELERNRLQSRRQMAYDDMEAEVYMDFSDEMEDERQCGVWQRDDASDSLDDDGYADDYDCED